MTAVADRGEVVHAAAGIGPAPRCKSKVSSVRILQPPQYAPGRQPDIEPPRDAIEADHTGPCHHPEIELFVKIDRNAAPDDEAAKPDRRQDHGVDDRQYG